MTALADMPVTLTVEEAAGVLRIGRSAAYQAVREGQIPAIRVGRCLRVPRQRLAELLGETDAPQDDHDPAAGWVAEEVQAGGSAGALPL